LIEPLGGQNFDGKQLTIESTLMNTIIKTVIVYKHLHLGLSPFAFQFFVKTTTTTSLTTTEDNCNKALSFELQILGFTRLAISAIGGD